LIIGGGSLLKGNIFKGTDGHLVIFRFWMGRLPPIIRWESIMLGDGLIKDLWQRYKNMRGFRQRFQNGFDCQGLWVEVEVEKELGFKNKKRLKNYGVENLLRNAGKEFCILLRFRPSNPRDSAILWIGTILISL